MDAAFAELEKAFGTIDFVVHSVAFANKDELKGSLRRQHHAATASCWP